MAFLRNNGVSAAEADEKAVICTVCTVTGGQNECLIFRRKIRAKDTVRLQIGNIVSTIIIREEVTADIIEVGVYIKIQYGEQAVLLLPVVQAWHDKLCRLAPGTAEAEKTSPCGYCPYYGRE